MGVKPNMKVVRYRRRKWGINIKERKRKVKVRKGRKTVEHKKDWTFRE